MTKPAAPKEEQIGEDHPGPGYELIDDHDAWWKIYYNEAEGTFAYTMPKEHAAEIEARAKAEGVSVEVYFRRKLGFPDEPPPEGTYRKKRLSTNDNREKLYRDMAHVKYFASTWNVTPAEVIERAAEAIDNDYSWQDIRYQITLHGQETNKLLRRLMAGETPSPQAAANAIAKYAWLLLLLGEMARRSGRISDMRDIAAQATKFQKTLDLFENKTSIST